MDRGEVFKGLAEIQAVGDLPIVSMDDDFADLSEFDEPEMMAARSAARVISRATKTRNRIAVRRAKSEAALGELLPPYIENGETWHVISAGDIDSLSFAKHLLANERFEYMLLSTWCMALQDVEQIAAWLDSAALTQLDAYTGEIFPSQYPVAYELLCACVRRHAGRVATFRNHSKVMLFANRGLQRYLVVESSANINTNPRTEQTAVTADAVLFRHYLEFFNDVKSFNTNFDSWVPYGR